MSHFNSTIQNMRLLKVKIFDHNINCPAISQVSREVSSKYDMGMICEYEYELPSYFSQIKKELVKEGFLGVS